MEWWGERLGRAMELDDRGDGLGCGAVGGETTMGDVTKRLSLAIVGVQSIFRR